MLNGDGSVKPPGLDNHGMGTVFEELVRRFNEENNEEAGEHWTPRDAGQGESNIRRDGWKTRRTRSGNPTKGRSHDRRSQALSRDEGFRRAVARGGAGALGGIANSLHRPSSPRRHSPPRWEPLEEGETLEDGEASDEEAELEAARRGRRGIRELQKLPGLNCHPLKGDRKGQWADVFWFGLFHEIGHILLHGRSQVILEEDVAGRLEKEADAFASDTLIPERAYPAFLQRGVLSLNNVEVFARQIGLHPGIVVERLQHDGRLPLNHGNHLRLRFDWKKP